MRDKDSFMLAKMVNKRANRLTEPQEAVWRKIYNAKRKTFSSNYCDGFADGQLSMPKRSDNDEYFAGYIASR